VEGWSGSQYGNTVDRGNSDQCGTVVAKENADCLSWLTDLEPAALPTVPCMVEISHVASEMEGSGPAVL